MKAGGDLRCCFKDDSSKGENDGHSYTIRMAAFDQHFRSQAEKLLSLIVHSHHGDRGSMLFRVPHLDPYDAPRLERHFYSDYPSCKAAIPTNTD